MAVSVTGSSSNVTGQLRKEPSSPMLHGVSIGEAARQSGVKVPPIRYSERIGLVPSATRSEGNRRRYGSAGLGSPCSRTRLRDRSNHDAADPGARSGEPRVGADMIATVRRVGMEKRIKSPVALKPNWRS